MKRICYLFLVLLSISAFEIDAQECDSYREFTHRDGVFSIAKLKGSQYNYQQYSRAYLALTDVKLLTKVSGNEQQEKEVLAKAEQDFKKEVEQYSTQCFEVVSSMDIGSYDYGQQQFKVTEVSPFYSLIFEAMYTRNNRFSRQYKLFLENYDGIKPIPYKREQIDSLLVAIAQKKANFLHRLYFDVVGIRADQQDSMMIHVHKVDVILEQDSQEIINSYTLE